MPSQEYAYDPQLKRVVSKERVERDWFTATTEGLSRAGADALDAGVDFVLVPGVAFDGDRGRLGHGAGFYDTWFAALAAGGAAPARVGVALADQLLPNSKIPDCPAAVPREAHDAALDAVVVAKRAS